MIKSKNSLSKNSRWSYTASFAHIADIEPSWKGNLMICYNHVEYVYLICHDTFEKSTIIVISYKSSSTIIIKTHQNSLKKKREKKKLNSH